MPGLLPEVHAELQEQLSSAAECQLTLLDPQHWRLDDPSELEPRALSSWYGGGEIVDPDAGRRMLDAIHALREATRHAAEQGSLLLVVL
jgi:hypothetical protein